MYEELIGKLKRWPRVCVQYDNSVDELLDKAADAIEELTRREKFHAFLWNVINPNDMQLYLEMYHSGNEKEEAKE